VAGHARCGLADRYVPSAGRVSPAAPKLGSRADASWTGAAAVGDLAECDESVRFGEGDSGAIKVSQACG
jgi:hypothetical protein